LPWGLELDAEQAAAMPSCPSCAAGVPLHPSFAYEIGFHLAAFVWLRWLRARPHEPGALLTYYLAAYAVFRFAVELTRDNEVVWLAMTRGQIFLLVVTPLLLWRVAVLVRRRPRVDDPTNVPEVPVR
jgi:prolipoprotein diacylglyceryltransferase